LSCLNASRSYSDGPPIEFVADTSSARIDERSMPGGGISEPPEFLRLLEKYNFETVDFRNQELSAEQQAKLLDGVALILAHHGAVMTSFVYLDPPPSVVEVMGARAPRAVFTLIASGQGFNYRGIYSDKCDESQNMLVDLEELEETISLSFG
jgi:hypothetical protein